MPRILRILNRLIVGGPLLNASYLTKYMDADFETMLVVGEKEDHEKDASFITDTLGIKPVYISEMVRSINPMNDYKAYKKICGIIKEFKPDIVHTHAAKPGAIGRMAAKAMGVPVIVHTYHGHVFHSYFNSMKTKLVIQTERFLAKKTDAIVAISETQKNEFVKDFMIAPESKFRIIPLGLDLEKFQTDFEEKRQLFRNEFGIDKDVIVISIIGRLVPVKNHALFLKAISFILKSSNKKIKAFIVGDGETRESLEEMAGSLDISFSTEKDTTHPHPLVFTSWRSDVDVINAGSDIIALTSLNEGTPVSLIEAQASNNPIVSTNVGGIQDVVLENETALISDINDEKGFFTNLLRLVDDDELRQNLGKNGAAFVHEKYTYKRLCNDMAGLYHELLNSKK
jgi:glycosyltransferase involved in cell wall biosynthesis